MPEFVLDHGTRDSAARFKALDSFTQGYIEAIFFTNTGTGDDEDLQDAHVGELAPSAWELIVADCARFQEENAEVIACAIACRGDMSAEYDDESAGRDFWYTRNHYGVGFWDRGLCEHGDKLTAAAHKWRELYLCRGDDGLIYVE